MDSHSGYLSIIDVFTPCGLAMEIVMFFRHSCFVFIILLFYGIGNGLFLENACNQHC